MCITTKRIINPMESNPLLTCRDLPPVELNCANKLLCNVPNQKKRLAQKNGSKFTILVTGESGTGKSTFIRSMFGTEYSKGASSDLNYSSFNRTELKPTTEGSSQKVKRMDIHRTAEIEIRQIVLEEHGFNTTLTIVDTPGFGDYTNNENTWVPIESYIDSQNRHYMLQEEQPERIRLQDTRVHLCLYFLAPTNRILDLDIAAMKSLGNRANLVPIIGKADSMTNSDRRQFKQLIRNMIAKHDINVWCQGPDTSLSSDNDYDWPFAIVSSDEFVCSPLTGEMVRGREFRWGTVEINNPEHSDFGILRDALVGKYMLNLIDDTHEKFYLPQRRLLRLHRLGTALNLNGEPDKSLVDGEETSRKIMDRPSVSCMFPRDFTQHLSSINVTAAADVSNSAIEEAAMSMSNLEVISIISKVGAKFLETEKLSQDAVLRQRAQALKSQFEVVTKFQQERFVAQSNELQKLHDEFVLEIQKLTLQNVKLEDEIKGLENEIKRRK